MQKKTEKVTFVLDYFSQIVKRFMLREKYSQKSRGRYCNVNYKTKFIWIVGYGLCNKNGNCASYRLLDNEQSSYDYENSVSNYYVIISSISLLGSVTRGNKSAIKTCTRFYKQNAITSYHDSHDLATWTPFPGYYKTLCILSPTVHNQTAPGPGWQPASLFWLHQNQPESIVICRSSLKTRCPPFHRLAYCIVWSFLIYEKHLLTYNYGLSWPYLTGWPY